jgi:hypothetical protein
VEELRATLGERLAANPTEVDRSAMAEAVGLNVRVRRKPDGTVDVDYRAFDKSGTGSYCSSRDDLVRVSATCQDRSDEVTTLRPAADR